MSDTVKEKAKLYIYADMMPGDGVDTSFSGPKAEGRLTNEERMKFVQQLSEKTGGEICESFSADKLTLHLTEEGLSLEKDGLSLMGDFTSMLKRLKHNNLTHEMLVKAAKLKNFEGTPIAVDATAGMGEDSLLLAAAGFEVHLFEYDPVIAALLQDTLDRSKQIPELKDIVDRMILVNGDSIECMKNLDFEPDVVLLDPMFPSRQKSGLIKKKFQLLQQLESPCSTEEELLFAAESCNPRKIVIKRPAKGPFLAGKKPDYSLPGKAIRYDCFMNVK